MAKTPSVSDLRARLARLESQGHALELEGLPFPNESIRESFEQALRSGSVEQAAAVVKGGETLLVKASQDWTWIRELLRRADELRAIAATLGIDLQHLDARVGNPRLRLQSDPLSSGSMEKAAASASLALAVLNDTIPKYCVQEAQSLGESIRRARNRGEDVRETARAFTQLLQAIQDQNLPLSAQRLVETRRAVSRIPRAPALPSSNPREEEEILLEARNLARRLQRIKGKARDAQTAARLMSQIRGALSEERRFGTPEEEIEALWLEVDRITRERRAASETETPGAPEPEPAPIESEVAGNGAFDALGPPPIGASEDPEPESEEGEDLDEERKPPVAFSPYDPYVPPEVPVPSDTEQDPNSPAARARARASRVRP
jgi:hypothetical protein